MFGAAFFVRFLVTSVLVALAHCFYCSSITTCTRLHLAKAVDNVPVTTIRPDESGRLPPAIEQLLGMREPSKKKPPSFKNYRAITKKLNREKWERRVARQPHYAERFKKYNETELIRRMHAKLAEKFEGKKDLIAEAERKALPFKGFGPPPVDPNSVVEPNDQELDFNENFNPKLRNKSVLAPVEVPADIYERKPEDGKLTSRPMPEDELDEEDLYDDDNDDDKLEVDEREKGGKPGMDCDFSGDETDLDQEREYDDEGNLVVANKPKRKRSPNPWNQTRSGPLNALGGYRFRRPPPVEPVLVEKQKKEEQVKQKELLEAREKRKKERVEFVKSQFEPFHFKSDDEDDYDDYAEEDGASDLRETESSDAKEGKEKDTLFVSSSFRDLGITNRVILNNLERMGVTSPTKVQGLVIPELMKGNKDVVIEAQTGSGKTLAFLLPLIGTVDPMKKKIQAVVIASSRELVLQISEVAESLFAGTPYEVLTVIGGANARHQIDFLREEKPQIIIATPGRLAEMVFGMEHIHLGNVRAVVIDEVDHLLQEPYLQEIEVLLGAVPMLHRSEAALKRDLERGNVSHPHYDNRRMVCFASATGNSSLVSAFCDRHLRPDWELLKVSSKSRLPESITHCVVTVPRIRSLDSLARVLNAKPHVQRALIFVSDPHRVQFLADKLQEYKKVAAPLHGSASKDDRKEILRRLRDGRVQFVVTTEISARGLDIPELTHVINFELPTDIEHYIHRAGRCGRMGREGLVINFATKESRFVLRRFAKKLGIDLRECEVREGQLFLRNGSSSEFT